MMNTVEVFSWWTGGGEAAGLDAMIEVFATTDPDITFENSAVAGGAGTNARAVLASRLQANDPPDSWQGHAGQELIGTYVAADQIEPLRFLGVGVSRRSGKGLKPNHHLRPQMEWHPTGCEH